ncbi:asparaginase [Paenibacillus sp. GCM10012307]|uniref:Asparaginase n=1 Tax=Paenibacillus roseus TaxID=2798579 RepID=A0A934J469_9BACL|nr:asparaginase [Paenibacillus roseus]MBJ6361339.1 asparaginase [Paenibacillus roseus]
MGAGLHSEGTPLVQASRGNWTETIHFGHVAVVDANGRLLAWAGDPGRIIFSRSALNPIIAVQAVLSGVLDERGPDEEQLAILTGRNEGTDRQVEVLEALLGKFGIGEEVLSLPQAYPLDKKGRLALLGSGQPPRPLYHAAAGRHVAVMALSQCSGWPYAGYTRPEHPAQQLILQRTAEFAGMGEGAIGQAQDSCGFPALALPLWRLALAYARLAAPPGDWADAALQTAARRTGAAMNRHPALVEGPGRLASVLLGDANAIARSGEQGVFVFALRRQRLGVAVSIADGSEAALPVAVAAILESLAATGQSGTQHSDGPRRLAAAVREAFADEVLDDHGNKVGSIEPLVQLCFGERYPRSRF